MSHKRKISGVIAAIIIALLTWGYDHFISVQNQNIPLEQTTSALPDLSRVWTRGRSGDAASNAAQHFQKHGKEFGFRTEQEYVAAAVAFTSSPSKDIMQNKQHDGDTAFYNPKTAEYAVKTKRGLIRTYFKLDPKIHGFKSNTDYFNAQARPPANDNRRK